MSRSNHQHAWETEEHPSLEELRHYQSGDLSAPQRHQIEQHLVSCEMCTDLLEGMHLAQPARVERAVRETRGRLKNLLAQKKRKRKSFHLPLWQIIALLFVLIFALAEVVYHHYFARTDHTLSAAAPSQKAWQVNGQVLDHTGMALPGATVKVKGETRQTITDQRGEFTLPLSGSATVLVISHPDFPDKEVTPSPSNNSIAIVLTK